MSRDRPIVRFAPSPNGYLHLGHAYSALLNQRFAKKHGGTVLLRLEDIDPVRSRPEFCAAIIEDLDWLGFSYQRPVMLQSKRLTFYADALARLAQQELTYPCFCSRSEVARAAAAQGDARDPDGAPLYPGTCRALSAADRRQLIDAGRTPSIRLDLRRALEVCAARLEWREFGETDQAGPIEAQPRLWGDVVVARRDFGTSYHLAVVVDDAAQGVTDVIRGRDLEPATHVHRLLQHLLGLPAPHYRHHRLVLDGAGRKLAKSAASTPLRELRRSGMEAGLVRQDLAFAMERSP